MGRIYSGLRYAAFGLIAAAAFGADFFNPGSRVGRWNFPANEIDSKTAVVVVGVRSEDITPLTSVCLTGIEVTIDSAQTAVSVSGEVYDL